MRKRARYKFSLLYTLTLTDGEVSVDGTASCYGLEGLGLNSGVGEICRTSADLRRRPTQRPLQQVTGLFSRVGTAREWH